MPENRNTPISDEMIRAAVCRELDSIESPSVESAWQRLQARQAALAAPTAPARRGRSWSRYSALAAALLLFFFGGYGVYRTINLNDPNRALLMGSPDLESDSKNILVTGIDEEAGTADYYSFSTAGWDPVEYPRGAEQMPPEALDGYQLENTFTQEADSGIQYLAVLYTRPESTLLMIQSDVRSRDQFIADLKKLLQLPVLETIVVEDIQSRLSINGLPALIWEKEGRYYLLWEMTGSANDTELKRLVPQE